MDANNRSKTIEGLIDKRADKLHTFIGFLNIDELEYLIERFNFYIFKRRKELKDEEKSRKT